MESPVETTPGIDFLTPPRILIPKLVGSRDKWKAKATTRKRLLHKEKIHTRDLSLSRQRWKDRALQAEQELRDLHQRLQRSESALAEAYSRIARLEEDSKKN